MKVIHFATNLQGGAGVAASALNRQLIAQGVDSKVFSRHDLEANGLTYNNPIALLNSKITTFSNELITKSEYGFTSASSVGIVNPMEILSLEPDLIHIHNWYNFLSIKDIKILTQKTKVVFTLHDTRLITGGCHANLGCQRYLEKCSKCPAVYALKSRIEKSKEETNSIFTDNLNVTVISPSEWLATEFKKVQPHVEVVAIPNLISEAFENQHSNSREMDNEKIKILFVASDINSVFKGGSLLVEAIERIEKSYPSKEIELTVVGGGSKSLFKNSKINTNFLPLVKSTDLPKLFRNHDLLVVPSTFDNFPTIVIEAQLCGLSVLGTRVGGIPELIEDGVNGFLCNPEPSSLAEGLVKAMNSDLRRIGNISQELASKRFQTLELIANHLNLYHNLLERHG